ncbi:hypothetical protein ES288_D11G344000v1 [Gossypium darwinii]|uniref:Uncharacterized protein n=1 Tax=Gossypium darwinii TaxID=34276 RepID=A0A5D2ASJ2_GOSDA|nr:hypothetical protein ES288_D11G344000v1 [Gossypium darwinii]
MQKETRNRPSIGASRKGKRTQVFGLSWKNRPNNTKTLFFLTVFSPKQKQIKKKNPSATGKQQTKTKSMKGRSNVIPFKTVS